MRHPLAAVVCLALAAGCGDPPWTFPPDAGEPDAAFHVDASVDAIVAIPDAAPLPPPDAAPPPPDAVPPPPDADPTLPVITAVATVDGFHQIRQGDSATIAITGRNLAGATAVTFGALTATDLTPTDDGLRATLAVPHGHAAGALALTVVTPSGSPAFPEAIVATPVVVTPGGRPDGRGTYESPLAFCQAELTVARRGDTIELPAGRLPCDRRIELTPGVSVLGAGLDQTFIVGGFLGFHTTGWESALGTTTLAGFTVTDAAGTLLTLDENAGRAEILDVAVDGSAFPAVAYGPYIGQLGRDLRVYDLRYRGTATAIHMVAMTSASISSCVVQGTSTGACIVVDGGTVDIADTTITGCGTGVDVAATWTDDWRRFETRLSMSNNALIDNRVGVRQRGGALGLEHVDIVDDPATVAVVDTGIALGDASLGVNDSRIEASLVGIIADARDNIPGYEAAFRIRISDSRVYGGQIGLDLLSAADTSPVSARRSVIEGGAVGVRVAAAYADMNFGTSNERGDNDLVSPGVAFLDVRSDWSSFGSEEMVGTRLNGHAYDGQLIEGPAVHLPDYRIERAIPYQF